MRPISLLNTIYKSGLGFIANKKKINLPILIYGNQTWFIPGQNI